MPTPTAISTRGGALTKRLEERDDYGIVLLLILVTIIATSLSVGAIGQFLGVVLSGFTLLFVLHTSDAHRRTYRTCVCDRRLGGRGRGGRPDLRQG